MVKHNAGMTNLSTDRISDRMMCIFGNKWMREVLWVFICYGIDVLIYLSINITKYAQLLFFCRFSDILTLHSYVLDTVNNNRKHLAL